ncbi:hypothetical protein HMH01_11755 [Halovulum dunhuangense]|uniref:Lipoprotein n=1 Tax=Halovulum dunhuangense TaxID=1505036 RepID=A0A849L4I0_9RHOB|nr:hypothetical protein [Halovulum dunhuangense]NNU81110.1 hypothetical protein [Halovulum dunhuangense]
MNLSRALVPFLAVLAACASPGPGYLRSERVDMQVGGHRFAVFAGDGTTQVIRTNRVWLPDTAEVMAAGTIAAERASGCKARAGGIRGDAAIMVVPLDCGGGP